MPVTKYRDVSEMPPPERVTGPDLAERIRRCWERARIMGGYARVRGVQRFRSVTEAQEARQQARIAHMRRLREERASR